MRGAWLRVPPTHTCEEHRLDCPLCVRHVQRATRVRAAAPSTHTTAAVTHARRVWRWVARVGAIPMVMDAECVWAARTHQRGAYGWWTIAGDHR